MDLFNLHSTPRILCNYRLRLALPTNMWEFLHQQYGFYDSSTNKNRLMYMNNKDELWKMGENIIARSPKWALKYAVEVVQGRWTKGEAVIKSTARTAYLYACIILRSRWPEAEPIILTSATGSYFYASIVLRARWPEAEEIIITHEPSWIAYKQHFLEGIEGDYHI